MVAESQVLYEPDRQVRVSTATGGTPPASKGESQMTPFLTWPVQRACSAAANELSPNASMANTS